MLYILQFPQRGMTKYHQIQGCKACGITAQRTGTAARNRGNGGEQKYTVSSCQKPPISIKSCHSSYQQSYRETKTGCCQNVYYYVLNLSRNRWQDGTNTCLHYKQLNYSPFKQQFLVIYSAMVPETFVYSKSSPRAPQLFRMCKI